MSMKFKILNLNQKSFIEVLRGTEKSNITNLPADLELIDIKYNLFSGQIQIIVRSDDFEDTGSYPIPNFTDNIAHTPIVASKPLVTSKPKPKVVETPSVNSNKIISAYQKEFNPEQIELLNFSVKGDYLIVKPAQYLKNEWNEINKVVKNIGGEWIKGSIISYWKIPI